VFKYNELSDAFILVLGEFASKYYCDSNHACNSISQVAGLCLIRYAAMNNSTLPTILSDKIKSDIVTPYIVSTLRSIPPMYIPVLQEASRVSKLLLALKQLNIVNYEEFTSMIIAECEGRRYDEKNYFSRCHLLVLILQSLPCNWLRLSSHDKRKLTSCVLAALTDQLHSNETMPEFYDFVIALHGINFALSNEISDIFMNSLSSFIGGLKLPIDQSALPLVKALAVLVRDVTSDGRNNFVRQFLLLRPNLSDNFLNFITRDFNCSDEQWFDKTNRRLATHSVFITQSHLN